MGVSKHIVRPVALEIAGQVYVVDISNVFELFCLKVELLCRYSK